MFREKNVKTKSSPLAGLAMEAMNQSKPEFNPELAKKNELVEQLKNKTLKNSIDFMEENVTAAMKFTPEERNRVKKAVTEILSSVLEEEATIISRGDRDKIISQVTDEITGFGPIEPFLHDPDITEVMVNGPRQVYVEKKGRITLTETTFRDDDHVRHTIEKIISPLGRRLDDTSPMVDARLPDGSRVNAIVPPLALNGPTITIRKFSADPYTIDDLLTFGTLSPDMAAFLKACVESRINIIISGGTGSGKTTLLNVISSFIPDRERIITIEDAAELQLGQEHVVSLESRPPNIEGKGQITIRDLVKNCLRMRPDRIVVGEVRGGEALDMLQAMNTGHDGSITTGHANSPRDILYRLETMVMMTGLELPMKAIREQIKSAIHLIVHQERFKDGSRKVTNITEITGMEGDTLTIQDIFVFKQTGFDEKGRVLGRHVPTGIVPAFIEKIENAGVQLPQKIFRSFERG